MTQFSMPVPEWGGFADQAPDFGTGQWAPRTGKHRGGRKQSGRVRKPNRRRDAVAAVVAFAGAYGFAALFTAIGCVVR